MTRSKWMLIAIIVLILLAFTAVSVMADALPPPQAGTVDEDGDLVLSGVPGFELDGLTGAPDLNRFPFSSLESISSAKPGVSITATIPISPAEQEIVHTKKPTFTFKESLGATNYRIQVLDAAPEPDVVIYTYKGNYSCSAGECSMTPGIPLEYYDFTAHKGIYVWRVSAKVSGSWEGYSSDVMFFVLSPGFESSFNINASKWTQINGSWTVVSPGYLKTGGIQDEYASVMEKHLFMGDFTYEVKMKLKSTDPTQEAGIIFSGGPYPLGTTDHAWDTGFYLLYRTDQKFCFWYRNTGYWDKMVDWTYVPEIQAEGWNTFKIVIHDEGFLTAYVNDTVFLSMSSAYDINDGWVGITMNKPAAGSGKLLVDWVKVTVPQ